MCRVSAQRQRGQHTHTTRRNKKQKKKKTKTPNDFSLTEILSFGFWLVLSQAFIVFVRVRALNCSKNYFSINICTYFCFLLFYFNFFVKFCCCPPFTWSDSLRVQIHLDVYQNLFVIFLSFLRFFFLILNRLRCYAIQNTRTLCEIAK